MIAQVRSFFARPTIFFTVATALLILGFGIYRSSYLPETDTLWQVRAGNETFQLGHIPTVETWDWLVQGRAWTPNSWLWNILLAVTYNIGGVFGLAVLNLILFTVLSGLAWFLLQQLRVGSAWQLAGVLLFMVGEVGWVTLRPQQIDYILLLVFLNVICWLRNKPRKHPLWWLSFSTFLITALWMNLHLTATAALLFFPLGYLLLMYPRSRAAWFSQLRPVVVIVVAVLAGLPATPFFIDGIIKTIQVSGASVGVIQEWGPLDFKQSIAAATATGIVIGGIMPLLYTLYRRRWLLAAPLLGLTVLSICVIRFMPYLVIFGLLTVEIAPHFHKLRLRHGVTVLLLGVLVFAGGLNGSRQAITQPITILSLNPQDFNVIPHGSRVLTLPRGGGSMLLFRPDISPALDGRNDLFGKDLYLKTVALFYKDSPAYVLRWLNQQHVNAVYFSAIDPASPLRETLRQAHWVEHDFPQVKIFVRPKT